MRFDAFFCEHVHIISYIVFLFCQVIKSYGGVNECISKVAKRKATRVAVSLALVAFGVLLLFLGEITFSYNRTLGKRHFR